MKNKTATINLRHPTGASWLTLAQQHIPELLSDHASCEKKAASMAITMMKYFHAYPKMLSKLSKIAREELVHYEQVLKLHDRLGIRFKPKPACRYARALWLKVDVEKNNRLIDQLMICAIIEARSCERFNKLAPILPEPLSSYYQRLYLAERRHAIVYLDFAREITNETHMQSRLERLLDIEGQVIMQVEDVFRFHSGVPSNRLLEMSAVND